MKQITIRPKQSRHSSNHRPGWKQRQMHSSLTLVHLSSFWNKILLVITEENSFKASMTRPLAYHAFQAVTLYKCKYSTESGLSSDPKCFLFCFWFTSPAKTLLLHWIPLSIFSSGRWNHSFETKLLTTNRWCADTKPIPEHASSNRHKSGVSKSLWSLPLLSTKLKTMSRNERKMAVDTIPLRKYIFATKPTTWQGVCLLYFKLIILPSGFYWLQNHFPWFRKVLTQSTPINHDCSEFPAFFSLCIPPNPPGICSCESESRII